MAQVKPHRGPEQGVGPCPRPVGAVHAGFDHTIYQIEVLRRRTGGRVDRQREVKGIMPMLEAHA